MLKRIFRLITHLWQRWFQPKSTFARWRSPSIGRSNSLSQATKASDQPSQPHARLQPPASQPTPPGPADPADDKITYTRPRSEVVTELNRALRNSDSSNSGNSQSTPDSDGEQLSRINSLADAAYLCECQNRLSEAENFYTHALELSTNQFGKAHSAVVLHLNNLAKFYYAQQRYAAAKPLLERSIRICQQHNTHRLEKAEALRQLAGVYCYLEDYAQAEVLFQQALSIFTRVLGVDAPRSRAAHCEFIQMLALVIESDQFETLLANLPPLNLDTLSETYSWAKPDWIKGAEPNSNNRWMPPHMPPKDEKK